MARTSGRYELVPRVGRVIHVTLNFGKNVRCEESTISPTRG